MRQWSRFPLGAFSPELQHTKSFWNLISADGATDRSNTAAGNCAVVCSTEALGFIDCWRQVGVVPRRQGAGERRLISFDGVRMDLDDWLGCGNKREGPLENVALEPDIAGRSERTAEWELAVQHPRGSHSLDDRQVRAQDDRYESGGFKNMGERTHGTRTEWSNGCEHHHVDPGGEQALGTGWAGIEPNL